MTNPTRGQAVAELTTRADKNGVAPLTHMNPIPTTPSFDDVHVESLTHPAPPSMEPQSANTQTAAMGNSDPGGTGGSGGRWPR